MSRILALDYGTKRIGVALTDETKSIALVKPYLPLEKKKELLSFIKDNDVVKILLGLPKGLKGQETAMTREVNQFAEWLKSNCDLPVEFIDERFSSKEAGTITKDKELIDSIVAQMMLARYLEQTR